MSDPLRDLSRLREFDLLNGALFRRPALDVEGRAYLRHVAYWPRRDLHPLADADPHHSAACSLTWLDHINSALKALIGVEDAFLVVVSDFHADEDKNTDRRPGRMTERRYTPREIVEQDKYKKKEKFAEHLYTPGDRIHASDTYLSPGFIQEGGEIRFRLRADIHIEYFTLTFIVDEGASKERERREERRKAGRSQSAIVEHESKIIQAVEQRLSGFWPYVASLNEAPYQGSHNEREPAYEELWDVLDACLPSRIDNDPIPEVRDDRIKRVCSFAHREPLVFNKGSAPRSLRALEKAWKLGKRSGDSEDLLVAERFADFRSVSVKVPLEQGGDASSDGALLWDFAPLEPEQDASKRKKPIDAQCRFLLKKEIQDWSRRALRVSAQSEVVLTGLLDGLAIYVSTLGRDSAHPIEADDHAPWYPGRVDPLRYLVTYCGNSAYQRGRVLRQLHDAGVLRLIALRDVQQVRYSTQVMRRLGQNLADSGVRKLSLNQLYDQFRNASRGGAGDLNYRAARSAHYVKRWEQVVLELRQLRMEGWQTYDEFIRRRLGSTFDYIDRAGARSVRLAQQFETAFAANAARDQARLALVAVWIGFPAAGVAAYQVLQLIAAYAGDSSESGVAELAFAGMCVYVALFGPAMFANSRLGHVFRGAGGITAALLAAASLSAGILNVFGAALARIGEGIGSAIGVFP